MNLLHDISAGEKSPEIINVIIEIPRGSKNKYEIDKETGIIKLDRVMHTAQDYPFDYGFVPQTDWYDGDALDVVVLTTHSLPVGILVEVRPVAVIHMVDSGERDEKIIAVPKGDPRFAEVKDLKDVNAHVLKEIEHFFLTYKNLQNKTVEINGIEGAAVAKACVLESQALYKTKTEHKS